MEEFRVTAIFGRFSQWHVRRRIAASLVVAVLCFALAVFAQRRLDRKLIDNRAFLAYSLAGMFFALTCGDIALERVPEAAVSPPRRNAAFSRSFGVLTVLLAVAFLGCLDFGGNRFRPLGLLFWGGGLCLCLCYLYLSERPRAFGEWLSTIFAGKPLTIQRSLLVLASATLIGAVLRLHQLEAIPADIGWDLPYNYTDTLTILHGEYPIFFPANQGREGLFLYLIALVARFATLSHFSIKLTSALVGIATIPALYLLGRELFTPSVGLVAALFLAVNRWHIVLSRSGFRVILLPLLTILALYAAVRALRSGRPFDFALAGLVLGVGLYTYTAFVFAVLAVCASLALQSMGAHPVQSRTLLPLSALMIAVTLVAYAPLARFAIEYPNQYLQRLGLQVRLVGSAAGQRVMTVPLLLENVRTSLLMYHVYGDSNVRFNVPFFRHFGFVSGMLLVLGLFYMLRRWRQGSNYMLLVMFFLLIVPMTLAMFPHEMPNVFRAAGTIGPALLLSTLPLLAVSKRVEELSNTFPKLDLRVRVKISSLDEAYEPILQLGRRGLLVVVPGLVIALLVAAECRETKDFYFHQFVDVLPDRQNVSIAKEMARQMEAYGDVSSCYIKVWPHWFDGRALQTYLRRQYGEWNPEFSELAPDQPPLSLVEEQAMIIVHPNDTAGLETLRATFPRHATVVHFLPDGTPAFIAVYVER